MRFQNVLEARLGARVEPAGSQIHPRRVSNARSARSAAFFRSPRWTRAKSTGRRSPRTPPREARRARSDLARPPIDRGPGIGRRRGVETEGWPSRATGRSRTESRRARAIRGVLELRRGAPPLVELPRGHQIAPASRHRVRIPSRAIARSSAELSGATGRQASSRTSDGREDTRVDVIAFSARFASAAHS
jgi:hypothetical protein